MTRELRGHFPDHFPPVNQPTVPMDLSIDLKRAALKASASVVSVISLVGQKTFCSCSGTIIDCKDGNGTYFSTILTSATLLRSFTGASDVPDNMKINVYVSDGRLFEGKIYAFDLHYNIAAIIIKSDAPFPIASLKFLDDSISIDPNESRCHKVQDVGVQSFQLRSHSDSFNLCPGEIVVAIGRNCGQNYRLMAIPGKFSLDVCGLDCKELLRADSKISRYAIGGPLINRYGEVIGVNFYDEEYTPFLPINIASECLEHFKKHGRFNRPWLGMEMTNLYAADVDKLEKIIHQFPNIFKGVIVEKVIPGSPANHAGILHGDVIVQCNENLVRSFLEFLGMIWDKTGESVELAVIRENSGAAMNIKIVVDDTSPDKFNSWPVHERRAKKRRGISACGQPNPPRQLNPSRQPNPPHRPGPDRQPNPARLTLLE